MTRELAGFHFTQRLDTPDTNDFILQFENANHAQKIAAWTLAPPHATPDSLSANSRSLRSPSIGTSHESRSSWPSSARSHRRQASRLATGARRLQDPARPPRLDHATRPRRSRPFRPTSAPPPILSPAASPRLGSSPKYTPAAASSAPIPNPPSSKASPCSSAISSAIKPPAEILSVDPRFLRNLRH